MCKTYKNIKFPIPGELVKNPEDIPVNKGNLTVHIDGTWDFIEDCGDYEATVFTVKKNNEAYIQRMVWWKQEDPAIEREKDRYVEEQMARALLKCESKMSARKKRTHGSAVSSQTNKGEQKK